MRELFLSTTRPDDAVTAVDTKTNNQVTDKRMATSRKNNRSSQLGNGVKRAFDICISLLALPILGPILLLIGIWIKLDTSGPVFYRGRRAAKGNRTFKILKFRTMYECPESYQGAKVTAQDDPRITPVGRWLRNTKLNELPQIWNVLKGDMSLVGPRPEDPDIAATWSEDTQREILSVRPGITSPASVVYRHEESLLGTQDVMSTYLHDLLPSKLRLDQLYVRHRSLWMDLDVLFWTLLVVIVPGLGTYQPPEASLFWGPLSRLIRRHFTWFTADLVITAVAFAVTSLFWRSFQVLHVGWLVVVGTSLSFAFLFSLTAAILGVNRIAWSRALASDIFDLVPAVMIATVTAVGINYFLPIFPVGLILLAAGLAFSGFVAARYRSRLITGLARRLLRWRNGPKAARERVLIVGSGESGELAAWLLRSHHRAEALQVVGYVDDDLYKQGVRIRGIDVLGLREDIPELVRHHDIGIILFAIHNIPPAERQTLLAICQQTNARVILLPDFVGTLNEIVSQDGKEEPSASQPEAEKVERFEEQNMGGMS